MQIDTGTLDELHPLGSLLPLATIVSYLRQCSAALKEMHRTGMAHGSLQPAHLVLDSVGTLTLLGCGESPHPLYMAPEQVSGTTVPASDQYAIGILIYQWLCGRTPFEGSDLAAQHLHATPPSLRRYLPTIPVRVERVVLTALAKNPEERYPSLEEFVEAMIYAVKTSMSTVPKEEPEEPDDYVQNPPVHHQLHSQPTFPIQGCIAKWSADQKLYSSAIGLLAILVLVFLIEDVHLMFMPHGMQRTQAQAVPIQSMHPAKKAVPSPTPTPVLHHVPFSLTAIASANDPSLGGITLDTYTASNLGHDLTQQESDGMKLTFTNISSPCQDVTFPAEQITDSIENAFFIPQAIPLPCSAPTATIKVATEQYSQTGTFPPNALYSIREQLSILPEDPASVLTRMMGQEEQNAASKFRNDFPEQYTSVQNPAYQFQEQNMLCIHTDPQVTNGYLSIAAVACATFVLDPTQLPYFLTKVEQAENMAIRTCKVETASLDTHSSLLTFDGAYTPIASLAVVLKGNCSEIT